MPEFYCEEHDNHYITYCSYCGVNIVQALNESIKCIDCAKETNEWAETPSYKICLECWCKEDPEPCLSCGDDNLSDVPCPNEETPVHCIECCECTEHPRCECGECSD
jgi:hypothetical protein